MADQFKTFSELAQKKRENRNWRVISRDRQSSTLVAAPHGGRAEPYTGKIAKAIAGISYSLYVFKTLKLGLHITSHKFDEPRAVAQASRHSRVVTIHGCDNRRSTTADVFVGGLDIALRDGVIFELREVGFVVLVDRWTPGTACSNICNRGSSGRGVQIEVSCRLRNLLGYDHNTTLLDSFTTAIQRAIAAVRSAEQIQPPG